MIVSFVGGTGPAGFGLAARFAKAGLPVAIGSRAVERAEEARKLVLELVPGASVEGAVNRTVVGRSDIVFLTVPFQAQRMTVEELASELAGKIVVSIANPIWVRDGKVWAEPPAAGSLAEEVQRVVPDARVVGAFHEIHVRRFPKIDRPIEADTIVTADDDGAKAVVMDLARTIDGLRPLDGGSLVNTRYVEGFVTVLVAMNFIHRGSSALRITGIKADG